MQIGNVHPQKQTFTVAPGNIQPNVSEIWPSLGKVTCDSGFIEVIFF